MREKRKRGKLKNILNYTCLHETFFSVRGQCEFLVPRFEVEVFHLTIYLINLEKTCPIYP